jgi:hypothetical protein
VDAALIWEVTVWLAEGLPVEVVIEPSLAGTAGVDTGVAAVDAAEAVLIGVGVGTAATTTVLAVSPVGVIFGAAETDGVEGAEAAATCVGAGRDESGSW